jgi:hypothetical protein
MMEFPAFYRISLAACPPLWLSWHRAWGKEVNSNIQNDCLGKLPEVGEGVTGG